ncbi:hypothetical protein BDF20DRAFT_530331 [Mycotypha africana]|uniref:uncharacterized protein n=1 Tax=Mycotypha africana TaxID=64632 RepID=UPI00230000D2|nr:uncharacterized protein BDF20DRAFT_530331 [Mycotypha africana]KAI8979766.1 hypothetical protein BDF20DRAFT_530331 [Mycotypha africana]
MLLKPSIAIPLLFIYISFSSCIEAFNLKSLFGTSDEKASEESAAVFGTTILKRSSRSDIPCNNYICPASDICVKKPKDCPCSKVTDKKCIVGDWYTCIRGDQNCKDVL